MTPYQIARRRQKIAGIKQVLAAEKRKFGGYFDNRGLRYVPLQLFIELEDYKGGHQYLKWFDKNFPDDIGYPAFLFERTFILFQVGLLSEASINAFQTFSSNIFIFDRFFGKQVESIEKWEFSNAATAEFATQLNYSSENPKLAQFATWLSALQNSEKFSEACQRFIEIE